jgi:hypothetical protein
MKRNKQSIVVKQENHVLQFLNGLMKEGGEKNTIKDLVS